MSIKQLLETYESLPLALRKEVELFIEFLAHKQTNSLQKETIPVKEPKEFLASELVSWSKEPDPTGAFGVLKSNPISLTDIRKKVWRR